MDKWTKKIRQSLSPEEEKIIAKKNFVENCKKSISTLPLNTLCLRGPQTILNNETKHEIDKKKMYLHLCVSREGRGQ